MSSDQTSSSPPPASPQPPGQHPSDQSPSRRTLALWIGGAVIVAGLAWLAWSLLGPAPTEVAIDDAVAAVEDNATQSATEPGTATGAGTQTGTDDTSSSDESTTADAASADGTWSVDTTAEAFSIEDTTGTFVGFRIAEELSSIGATTAIGRTPVVTGGITIQGQELAEATVTADLTAVVSDEPRRENAIQRALGTDAAPAATFVLTAPVDLGAPPTVGTPIEVDATGDLTVNGVTKSVTIPLAAVWTGDIVVVTGSVEVSLADFDVTAPSARIVVSVADEATIELQLYLSR